MSSLMLSARVKDPLASAQSAALCVLMLILAPVWIRAASAAERRYETEWDSSDLLSSPS